MLGGRPSLSAQQWAGRSSGAWPSHQEARLDSLEVWAGLGFRDSAATEQNLVPREPPSQGSQPDQRRHKSVEWSSLPQPSSSSSGGAGSDSSSCQLAPEEAQAPRGMTTKSLGREEPSEGEVGSPRDRSPPSPAGRSQPVQPCVGARHPHRQTPREAPLEGFSPGQQMTSAGGPSRSKVSEPDHPHMGSGLR